MAETRHSVSVGCAGALLPTGAAGLIALLIWAWQAGEAAHPQNLFNNAWYDGGLGVLVLMLLAGIYALASPHTGWPMPPVRTEPWKPWRAVARPWRFLQYLSRLELRVTIVEVQSTQGTETENFTVLEPPTTAEQAATIEPDDIRPELTIDTRKSSVRIAVHNPGRDAFFKGEIWLIEGTTGSYYYPIAIKWEAAKGESLLIPAHDTRYLELATVTGTDQGWRMRFPDIYGEGGTFVAGKYENQAEFTIALKVVQTSTQSPVRGFTHLKLSIRVDVYCAPDGELVPVLEAKLAADQWT